MDKQEAYLSSKMETNRKRFDARMRRKKKNNKKNNTMPAYIFYRSSERYWNQICQIPYINNAYRHSRIKQLYTGCLDQFATAESAANGARQPVWQLASIVNTVTCADTITRVGLVCQSKSHGPKSQTIARVCRYMTKAMMSMFEKREVFIV